MLGTLRPCLDTFCRVMAGERVQGRSSSGQAAPHPQWPCVQKPGGAGGGLGCTREPVESASLWASSQRPLRAGAPGGTESGGVQRVGAGVSTWGLAVCGSDKMRPGSVAGWCTQGHGGRGQGARAWAASRSGQGVTASDGRGGVRRAGATWDLGASGPDALTSDRQIFTRMIRKL